MDSQSFPQLSSPRKTYFMALYGGFALLVLLFLGSIFVWHLSKTRASLHRQLEIISRTAALGIDANKLKTMASELLTGSTEQATSAYSQELETFLEHLQVQNQLQQPIQLIMLTPQGDNVALTWPVDRFPSSQQTNEQKLLLAQSSRETNSFQAPVPDNSIRMLIPIQDEKKQTIAYLKAEMALDKNQLYFKTLREIPWLHFGLFLSFLSTGFVFIIRSFTKKQRQDSLLRNNLLSRQEEIQMQNDQIKAQDEWIKKTLEELESAKEIIEQRNKELKVLNKVLDIKVQRRTKELEKTSLELSTFLYRSSHDIMGPIATLKGLCNLALAEIQEHKSQNYIKLVNATVERLNHTIKNISVVFEIRNRPLNFHSLALNELVHSVFNKQLKQFNSSDTKLEIDIPQGQKIISDTYLLETILTELIENAFSSLQNRKMQMEGLQHNAYIKVSTVMEKEKINILVNDSGIGLSKALEKELNNLFNQKAHAKNKGYGMGLYVVKSAVERLKGHISILEKKDQGALFQVCIPLRE
jgi:signal transduction histidine kinase